MDDQMDDDNKVIFISKKYSIQSNLIFSIEQNTDLQLFELNGDGNGDDGNGGEQDEPDIKINEHVCCLIRSIDLLQENGDEEEFNLFIKQLIKQSIKYDHCYIILNATDPNLIINCHVSKKLVVIYSILLEMKSQNFNASLIFMVDYQDLAQILMHIYSKHVKGHRKPILTPNQDQK